MKYRCIMYIYIYTLYINIITYIYDDISKLVLDKLYIYMRQNIQN